MRNRQEELTVPVSSRQLADRIRDAVKSAGGNARISAETGIPVKTLGSYLAGTSEPNTSRLVALARATGVSLDWLATGEGPMRADRASGLENANIVVGANEQHEISTRYGGLTPQGNTDANVSVRTSNPDANSHPPPALDEETLGLIVEGIEAVYKEESCRLTRRDLGRLAARLHADLATLETLEERRIGLKPLLSQLHRELRTSSTSATAETKQSA